MVAWGQTDLNLRIAYLVAMFRGEPLGESYRGHEFGLFWLSVSPTPVDQALVRDGNAAIHP